MNTAIVTPAPTSTPRPVPWHRLAWVAWRRYRTTLIAVVALLGVIAIFLLLRGHQMRDAYAAAQACAPPGAANCKFAFSQFHNTYGNSGPLGGLFVWLPAIIGAFAGAPLLARELESGTFRYAWTQGMGRTRWGIGLIVSGVLGVTVLSAALGMLLTWYYQPLIAADIQQRLHVNVFPVTGIAVVGWALFAFTLGVLVGLLTRRVLPALALTFAAWTGLAFLAGTARDHYATPLATSNQQLAPGAVPIDQWWAHGGVRVTNAQINQVLQSTGLQIDGGGYVPAAPGSSNVDPVQYLLQHGYLQMTSYQPDSRYWQFQWIEFGWLAVLSVLLISVSIWLVRRHPG